MKKLFGIGSHTKESAAKNSVLAAFGLVSMKLVVGIMSGSLGILAEAIHSGLDLIAAIMTYISVRISSKSADYEHPYGHGKIENLSALFETLLLLLTCFWIIYAAINRIMIQKVEIEVTFWAFAVMIISIFVDISRSRMLYRASKKYNSQALEADALHFSTDIWSSSVVILGLICVGLSDWLKRYEFLHYADAIAAIFVGVIVINVSLKLGVKTINALLDTAPKGLKERIEQEVNSFPVVKNCHQIRIRNSGPSMFIDLHIHIDGGTSLKEAHDITEEIEKAIAKIVPNADVTIHPEPFSE
jgi:cation diffusion facilitator family transporter